MKRYTDINKWDGVWFRDLSIEQKLFWLFLFDECSNAGIWTVDFERAKNLIGIASINDSFLSPFYKKITVIENGKNWFILEFIELQYVKLSPRCGMHIGVLKELTEFGLYDFVYEKGLIGNGFVYVDTSLNPRPNSADWYKTRKRIFKRDSFTCQYCGAKNIKLECDHIMPVSKGGNSEDSNLLTACFICNRSKRDKTVEEWRN